MYSELGSSSQDSGKLQPCKLQGTPNKGIEVTECHPGHGCTQTMSTVLQKWTVQASP